jgi:hypothetical protein
MLHTVLVFAGGVVAGLLLSIGVVELRFRLWERGFESYIRRTYGH